MKPTCKKKKKKNTHQEEKRGKRTPKSLYKRPLRLEWSTTVISLLYEFAGHGHD